MNLYHRAQVPPQYKTDIKLTLNHYIIFWFDVFIPLFNNSTVFDKLYLF